MYKVIEEKLINYGTVNGERTAFVLAHIVCDTASDKPQPLPHWVAGSRCDVLENNGTVYLLSNARQWEQVNFYNQGEGGEFDPDNYYTKDETDYEITEKVAEIVADAPEDFDTLKEMSDWIAGHEDSAAAMNSQIQANTLAIAGKVDKVTGKGLSTEDYTTAEKAKLAELSNYDDTALQTAVANKVDKVSGKGLSTEDYTTAEKTKLAGIEAGANNITVDSALSSSSTNPVQNKAINSALSNKISKNGDTSLSGTFEPQQNYGSNLGSSSYRFDKIYGKDLYLTNALSVANGGTGCTTLDDLKDALDIESFSEPTIVDDTTIDTLEGTCVFAGSGAPIEAGLDWAGIQIGANVGYDGDCFQLVTANLTNKKLLFRKKEHDTWSNWERICFYNELPTIDASLSSSSENPVQNKVINAALNTKLDSSAVGTAAAKDYTSSVSSGGAGLPTSGAVYSALLGTAATATNKHESTSITSQYVRIVGNVVFVNILFTTSAPITASTSVHLATLSASCKPAITAVGSCIEFVDKYTYPAWVNDGGQIRINTSAHAIPANAELRFTIAYPIS